MKFWVLASLGMVLAFTSREALAIDRVRSFTVDAGHSAFLLSWSYQAPANLRNVSFRIQRKKATDSTWSVLPEQPSTARELLDRAPQGATQDYNYRIRVMGLENGRSVFSDWRWISPTSVKYFPVPSPLRPPSSLIARTLSPNTVELEWVDNNSHNTNRSLVIERREVGGTFSPHIESPVVFSAGNSIYSDVPNRLSARKYQHIDSLNVIEGKRYEYRIKVKDFYRPENQTNASIYSAIETIHIDPMSLSREVICEQFRQGNRDIFSAWRNPMTVDYFTDSVYGADPLPSGDDFTAFANLANELSGTTESPKTANKVVIIPPGDYFLNRVEMRFQLRENEVPPTENRFINDPNRSTPYVITPQDLAGITSHSRGSDIQFKSSRRFRILGCSVGDQKPLISVAGDFTRDPRPLIISPRRIVNGTVQPVPEREARVLMLDSVVPFKFDLAEEFSLEGLEIRGNSQLSRRNNLLLESGNSAVRTTASGNYILRDLEVHHFNNDGIYIGNGANRGSPIFIADNGVRIHNIYSHHNTRIALMIAQVRNLMVSLARLEKSGLNGDNDQQNPAYPGNLPMAGVDVEPNTVPLSVTFGVGPNAKTYNSETRQIQINNTNVTQVVLRKNDGIHYMIPVDKITGNVSFENCLFNKNIGRAFQSSLKKENAVPLTENISIRSSVFRASGLEQETSFGLITRNGVVQFNDMELGPGNLSWGHNLGYSVGISNQNEHASMTFSSNFVSSSGSLTNEWGRQPLWITDNIFESTHSTGYLNSLQSPNLFSFIRVNPNPKLIFQGNTVRLSPSLLSSNAGVMLIFAGRQVSDNRYQLSRNLESPTNLKFQISYGRATAPRRRAEYRNESYSAEFTPQFRSDGGCLWDEEQNPSASFKLPAGWLCQPLSTYNPVLPRSVE